MDNQPNKLKELRQKKGISLDKLSKELQEKYQLSLSASQLMYYEKGTRKPRNSETWDTLADFFGVSVGYLLGYHEATFKFTFPNDEKSFYTETQKMIDLADSLTEDNEIYQPMQEIREMAIILRSVRKKIESIYGKEIYNKLNRVRNSFEFLQYLNLLLSNEATQIDADLLIYTSLLNLDNKKNICNLAKQLED